jgi:hypothetical protein
MGLQPTHDDEKPNFAPPLTGPRLQGAVTTWPISIGFSTER